MSFLNSTNSQQYQISSNQPQDHFIEIDMIIKPDLIILNFMLNKNSILDSIQNYE